VGDLTHAGRLREKSKEVRTIERTSRRPKRHRKENTLPCQQDRGDNPRGPFYTTRKEERPVKGGESKKEGRKKKSSLVRGDRSMKKKIEKNPDFKEKKSRTFERWPKGGPRQAIWKMRIPHEATGGRSGGNRQRGLVEGALKKWTDEQP